MMPALLDCSLLCHGVVLRKALHLFWVSSVQQQVFPILTGRKTMKRKVQQMIRYPEEKKIIRDDKIPEPVVMGTVGGEISMWGRPC